MRRLFNLALVLSVIIGLFGTIPANIVKAQAPTTDISVDMVFSPDSVAYGQIATLVISLHNNNLTYPLTSMQFNHAFPSGFSIADLSYQTTDCVGTLTGGIGDGAIVMSGGTLAANTSCTITMKLNTGLPTAYADTFASGDIQGTINSVLSSNIDGATAPLTVTAAQTADISVSMAYSPASIEYGTVANLNIVIQNNNATYPLQSIDFTHTLPTGFTIASPSGLDASTCVGSINGPIGGDTITLSSGEILASSSCTLSVNLHTPFPGSYPQTISSGAITGTLNNVLSTNISGASAPFAVTGSVPTADIAAVPVFSPDTINQVQVSQLTITLSNARTDPFTSAAFSLNLPTGLVVDTPASLSSTCGVTPTTNAGRTQIVLSGGTIPASSNCTVTADISAAGFVGAPVFTIGVGAVTGEIIGVPYKNAASASDTLTVTAVSTTNLNASVTFTPNSILLRETSVLSIVLNNGSSYDLLDASLNNTFPSGMAIANPNNLAYTCSNSTTTGTVTANVNATSLLLSGGTIPAGGFCTITVSVDSSLAGDLTNTIQAGDYLGTLNGVASSNTNPAGNPLHVTAPAQTTQLSVSKAFVPSTIAQQGVSRMTLILNNAASADLLSASLDDIFPSGLSIADTNVSYTCSSGTTTGSVAAAVNATSLTLTGGTIPAGGSCTIEVNVKSSIPGNRINTIESNGLQGTLSGAYSSNTTAVNATLNVASFDFNAEINKTFIPAIIVPGDIARLQVSIYNSNSFSLNDAHWDDALPANVTIAAIPNASTTDCGEAEINPADRPIVTASAGGTSFSLDNGTVPAGTALLPGTCTVSLDVTATVPGNKINTIPGGELSATANGGADDISNTDPSSATLNVLTITPPSITKGFVNNTIWVNQTSLLTIRITNTDLEHDITEVNLTDILDDGSPTHVVVASAVATPLSGCGPSATLTAGIGSDTITLTNALIAHGPTGNICQIQVNVTSATQGEYTDTIAIGALQTRQGVTNATIARDYLHVQAVGLAKAFSISPINAGDLSLLTITLRNPTGSDYTGVTLADVLPGNVVTFTNATLYTGAIDPTTTCGSGVVTLGSTNRTNDTITLTGGTIPSGSVATPNSCTITAHVTSPTTALDGNHINVIDPGDLHTDQLVTNLYEGRATLNVQALSIGVAKSFSPSSIQQGGTTTVMITLYNPTSSVVHVTTMTDTLPDGLVPNGAATTDCAGGTASVVNNSPDASTLTLTGGNITGGSLALPGHCHFSVPVSIATNRTYTNIVYANTLTTTEGLTNLDQASQSIVVYPTGYGLSGSKSFGTDQLAAGGSTWLRIRITAPADMAISGLDVIDNLPPNLVISASPTHSNSCGGAVDYTAGGSTVHLTNGILSAGASCDIYIYNVTSSVSGTYLNTIHSTIEISNAQGQIPPYDLTDDVTFSHLTMSKAFYPSIVAPGGRSTLTITLTNSNTSALTGTTITQDDLSLMSGADITVADPANETTTCLGGHVDATPGSQIISLSNATVPAKAGSVTGTCKVSVDVIASDTTAAGPKTNTLYRTAVTGTISGLGTAIHPVADAQAILTITPLSLGVVKSFNPLTVFGGSSSTLSVQLINPNATPLTGITFTDTMPAGMYIATPADPNKGTCGGTLSATPGATSFSYNGGTLAAGKRCTLTLMTTMNVHGNRTNTIPIDNPATPLVIEGVSSFNGAKNPQAASASLTNLPGASVTKFFTPNEIVLGDPATMTIRITNTGNIALSNVGLTDVLPIGMTVAASPAIENHCGGLLGYTEGTRTISLSGGGLIPGPNTTCDMVFPIVVTDGGFYTNTIATGVLYTEQGATNRVPATDTLTVRAAPTMQLVKTLNTALSDPAPFSTDPAHDSLVYSLVLSNTGDVPLTGVTLLDDSATITTCSELLPSPGVIGLPVSATLEVGDVITCQAGYTILPADELATHHINIATADSNETAPVTDTVTVPTNQSSMMTFNKVITTVGPYEIGDTLNYTITATNIGTGSLTNVTILDSAATLGTCTPSQPATLLAGESMSCTASHVVNQANVDTSIFTNTATGDSADIDTPMTDTVTVPIENNARLEIYKQVTSVGPYSTIGNVITYDISALNSGDQTLTGVTITDPGTNVTLGTCTPAQPATLSTGQILSCAATHAVDAADLTAGGFNNTAFADSDQTEPVSATAQVITLVPTISLSKVGTPNFDVVAPNGVPNVGDTISYAFTVTNTGDVTLTNITMIDIVGGVTISGGPIVSLAPDAIDSTTFTGIYTLKQTDIDAGTFTNTASVVGIPTVGPTVSDTDSDTQTFTAAPGISLVKTGTLHEDIVTQSGSIPATRAEPNDSITYAFRVENTGNVTLTNITLADTVGGVTITGGPIASLAPGAVDTTTFTGSYLINQTNIDAGTFNNRATVTANTPASGPISTYDDEDVTIPAYPSVDIVKTGTLNMDYVAPNGIANVNDRVNYGFTVTNTGNVTLTNVGIADPGATISGSPIASLAPGASSTAITGYHSLSRAEIDAGTYTNTATVTGTRPVGGTVTDTDDDTQTWSRLPSIVLTKTGAVVMNTVPPNTRVDVGDRINYTFSIQNTGNVTLSNVTISELVAGVTLAGGPLTINAGATSTGISGYHLLTQADIDAGTFYNNATATGTPPAGAGADVSSTEDDTRPLVQVATVGITKAGVLNLNVVAPTGIANPGDTITYTINVTNTGNTTLTNLTVVDNTAGVVLTGSPIASLAPGASNNSAYTATYTLTQANIDAGTFVNSVTVTATPPIGGNITNTATDTRPITRSPLITLDKAGLLHLDASAPSGIANPGDTITYSFTVTNTGNVTLSNMSIVDTIGGITIIGSPIASLAPGASNNSNYTGTYEVTQVDVDAGTFTNTARVTGSSPGFTNNVTITDNDVQTLPPVTGITLVKSSVQNMGSNSRIDAGETLSYGFAITNTSNVTLHGIVISDLSASISGGPLTLAPGAANTTSITGTHLLTQAELDTCSFHNDATVNGYTPSPTNTLVTIGDDNDTPFVTVPSILLEMDGTLDMTVTGGTGQADAGDVINYTFRLTNTGNVTLTGISLSNLTGGITLVGGPTLATLAPGAINTTTFTGSYTLTQADIDAGVFNNQVQANSTAPLCTSATPTSTAAESIPLTQAASVQVVKSGLLDTSIVDPAGQADAGDTITYTITVTNTGNVTLTNLIVTENTAGVVLTGSPIASLAPGVSNALAYSAAYTLTQTDIDLGTFLNSIDVTAAQPIGPNVTDNGTDTRPLTPQPSISLDKAGTLNINASAPNGIANPGDTITYTFRVENTSNVTLTNISLTDPVATISGGPIASLLPDGVDTTTFTGSYTLTQADVDAGSFTNTARVTASSPGFTNNVTITDNDAQTILPVPGITLVKSSVQNMGVDGQIDAGDTISYGFAISNTGNVTLDTINVSDLNASLSGGPLTLAPGVSDSISITGQHTVSQAEIDACFLHNDATVDSLTPANAAVSGNDDLDTNFANTATIELVMTGTLDPAVIGSVAGQADAGDQVNYAFTIRNTGNVTLNNITLSNVTKSITLAGGPTLATLAPGDEDTTTFTGSYTLTQADIDAGTFDNEVQVRADPTCVAVTAVTDNTTEEVPIPRTASILLDKAGVLDPDVVLPLGHADPGDQMNYTFTVTNTGNVTLSNVTLADTVGGVTINGGPIASLTADTAGILNVDSTTFTGSYTLTQDDVDAGVFDNTAMVTGTPPTGTDDNVTDEDTFSQGLGDASNIGLAKRLVGTPVRVTPGVWDVTFELLVRNYGNVTLHNVQVTDDMAATFGPDPFTVQSLTSSDTLPKLTVNPAYNGTTDINLLSGTDDLAFEDEGTLLLVVRVTPSAGGIYNSGTNSYDPFLNSATASGQPPTGPQVTDVSQDGTNPDLDGDGNPTNDNQPTEVDFGANLFDPPFGMKVYDASGLPVMRWTMVWINDTNIVAINAEVSDPIPLGTVFQDTGPGTGTGLPIGAPDESTIDGVSCTVGLTSVTTTTRCYYEGPTPVYPRGRIVWQGSLGPDLGVTDPTLAVNDLSIVFNVLVDSWVREVNNVATIDADLNGDGTFDGIEIAVDTAEDTWSNWPNNLPITGFAPGVKTDMSERPMVSYADSDLSLEIPSLKINAPIVGVPISHGIWNLDWLGNDVGYLEGTSFPTWNGNSGLTAHNTDANGNPGLFANLETMRFGQQIIIHGWGERYIYEVRSVKTMVDPKDSNVITHEKLPWLTLITCRGYDEKTDSYRWRVAVRAVLVRTEPE